MNSEIEKILLYGASRPNPRPSLVNSSCLHLYVVDSVSSSSSFTHGSHSSSSSNFSVGNNKSMRVSNFASNDQDFMKPAKTTMNSNNAVGTKYHVYCVYCGERPDYK